MDNKNSEKWKKNKIKNYSAQCLQNNVKQNTQKHTNTKYKKQL